ncbi:YqjF family protein [Streptomyces sp. NPDC012746]|uniref:YqjF family protein n=1 Tax=Streptomyces sp. NPDC012746 TaxID=3364845 RepID=UPI0036A26763
MVEPVTPEPPRPVRRTLLNQSWLDVAFVHWAVDPEAVGGLLPRGVRPDVYEGATYVGLIAFRMHRVGWFGLPGVPYFGNFPETNVRLYSVDELGRRGVVFRSFEASRLLPVLIARLGFQLPYMWAEMSVRQRGDVIDYAARRRRPRPAGSGGAHARISIRIGERIAEPSGLDDFLTARWGLHGDWYGRSLYLPNVHPRWRLHRAELLHLDENLITAAGLPRPAAPPNSVLFSPGVPVRFGAPI